MNAIAITVQAEASTLRKFGKAKSIAVIASIFYGTLIVGMDVTMAGLTVTKMILFTTDRAKHTPAMFAEGMGF